MFNIFCEFSLFVNIKYMHNIRDNKLNRLFSNKEKLTEKLLRTIQPISTRINQNLMDWTSGYGLPIHKLSWKSVKYVLIYPSENQTNTGVNITS